MLLQSTVRLAFTNDPDIDKRYENLQTLSSQSDRLIKSSEFKKLITYKDSCEPVEKYIGAVSAIGKYIYFNAEKLSIEVADQSGMMLLTDKAKEYHQYASSSPPEIPRMQK
ncbi:MAG: hypothetical protein AB7F64_04010 [Gammaproteobacteria bacterium]